MKKLVLVALLLVAVLLISWWAKGSNFSLSSMIKGLANTQAATPAPNTAKGTIVTPTSLPVEILITLTPSGFVPDVLMISQNTRITWVNKTPFTANISSDSGNANTFLNLGDFGENGSVSVVFSTAGRYHYMNDKNPSQKGTIIVR